MAAASSKEVLLLLLPTPDGPKDPTKQSPVLSALVTRRERQHKSPALCWAVQTAGLLELLLRPLQVTRPSLTKDEERPAPGGPAWPLSVW